MAVGILPAIEQWATSPIPDYFPGQTTAGFTPLQQQAGQTLQSAAKGVAEQGQQYGDAFSQYLAGGPRWNPYLNQVAQNYSDEMNRQFAERALPALRGSQVASNAAGSTAAAMQDRMALDDAQRRLSQQLADLYRTGFESTENRYLSTLGQAPGQLAASTAAAMLPGQTEMTLGTAEQALNQQRLEDEQKRWAYYRDAPERRLSNWAGLLGTATGATGPQASTQTSGTAGNFNFMQGLMGGLMPMLPSAIQGLSNLGSTPSSGYTGAPPGNLYPGRELGNVWGTP